MSTYANILERAKDVLGTVGEAGEDGTFTVRLEAEDLAFTLFSDNQESRDVFIRARIAALEGHEDPGSLCEEALQGNFFWSGTAGGTLSINDDEQALYLTDRREAEDLDDDEALAAFCDGFVSSVRAWRERCDTYLPVTGEKEG